MTSSSLQPKFVIYLWYFALMGGKVKADMLNTSFLDYSQLTFAVRTMLLQILHPPMDGILWDSTSASVYLEGVSVFQVSKRQQRKIKHDIQSKKKHPSCPQIFEQQVSWFSHLCSGRKGRCIPLTLLTLFLQVPWQMKNERWPSFWITASMLVAKYDSDLSYIKLMDHGSTWQTDLGCQGKGAAQPSDEQFP